MDICKKFIEKSTLVHNGKYNYEFVEYINSNVKVKIVCPKHGIFMQKPAAHQSGKGCLQCSKSRKINKFEFKILASKKHNNKYSYDLVEEFKNTNEKIKIICPEHGIFLQIAKVHLRGSGCPECVGKKKYSTGSFIKKSSAIHNNKYTYEKVKFKNIETNVVITCPIHGDFEQNPRHHMNGSGCKECGKNGYTTNGLRTFYIQRLTIDNKLYGFKYGITNNPQRRRQEQERVSLFNHELIYQYENIGKYIYLLEKYVKSMTSTFKTLDKNYIPDGYTETVVLESEDILLKHINYFLKNNPPEG